MKLPEWITPAPRVLVLGTMVYAGLVALSAIYILVFNWWGLDDIINFRILRLVLAATAYGAIFWALMGFLAYYIRYRLDEFGRRAFLVIAAIASVFWILVWPGLFDADSFIVMQQADRAFYGRWHGPSSAIAGAVLQHIPLLGAVGWVQLLFFSVAAAYAFQTLRAMTGSMLGIVLMAGLMLVSAPFLYNLMFVGRESWLAVLSLFLVVDCVQYFREPHWRDGRTAGRIIALGVIGYYLRSEAATYLALSCLVILGRHLVADGRFWKAINVKAVAWRAFAPSVALLIAMKLLVPIGLPGWIDQSRYDMSLWIDPIGDILSEGDAGIAQEDLDTIYAVVPKAHFKDWANKNIVAKFFDAIEDGTIDPPATDVERKKVMRSVVNIILARPGPYLKGRLSDFAVVDAPHKSPYEIAVQPTQAFIDSPRAKAWAAMIDGSPHYGGWFPDARRAMESFFKDTLPTPIGAFQWAIVPDLVILVFVIALFPWQPGFAFGALLVVSRVPPLFLLMPEGQSKYFSPIEFALPFLIAGVLAAVWPALRAVASRNLRSNA
ncbi:MAG: hypothetical protein Q8R02_08660 [Hyphomonadaceae bacterium]|nr:hypothetical protein [Hyphomonadaceae bacterium]